MAKLAPPVNRNDHVLGPENATVTLVEYGDYQCPHCGAAYPIVHDILRELGNRLRFVYRHFPLTNMHPYAFPAALGAEAAGRQNKFWEMHDMIFENQSILSDRALLHFAGELGVNIVTFKIDLQDQKLVDKVESDFESGIRSGVNGTPSFYINGHKHNGPYDFNSLMNSIEEHAEAVR